MVDEFSRQRNDYEAGRAVMQRLKAFLFLREQGMIGKFEMSAAAQ